MTVRFVFTVYTASRDVYGNCYHFAHLRSTATGRALAWFTHSESNARHELAQALAVSYLDWETLHFSQHVLGKREWQRLAKTLEASHDTPNAASLAALESVPPGRHWRGPWSLKQRRDGSLNVYCGPHDVALAVHRDNAPLVRAAPDLLRALQRLADCPDLNLEDLEPETCEAIAQAQAALAMAADGLP